MSLQRTPFIKPAMFDVNCQNREMLIFAVGNYGNLAVGPDMRSIQSRDFYFLDYLL